MNEPLITVLLPIFDETPEYLSLSVDSILAQTCGDFELLLLDDGSTAEPCVRLIAEYETRDARIRVIRNPKNIGLTRTLNMGLREARGEFIARQDSDDLSDPRRFERQLAFMREHPDYALCGSWAIIMDKDGKAVGRQRGAASYADIRDSLILINPFIHSSWFFRTAAIRSVGGYSEAIRKSQDYELLLRLAPRFPIANIPEFLCSYRMSDKSISFRDNKHQEKFAIQVRLRALREYGYPKTGYLQLIRPLFFYLFVPSSVKKFLMRQIWKI